MHKWLICAPSLAQAILYGTFATGHWHHGSACRVIFWYSKGTEFSNWESTLLCRERFNVGPSADLQPYPLLTSYSRISTWNLIWRELVDYPTSGKKPDSCRNPRRSKAYTPNTLLSASLSGWLKHVHLLSLVYVSAGYPTNMKGCFPNTI